MVRIKGFDEVNGLICMAEVAEWGQSDGMGRVLLDAAADGVDGGDGQRSNGELVGKDPL
jgi:hypothetical protein